MILTIYRLEPTWPANPGRPIYYIDPYWVETDGPLPSTQDIQAFLTPPPATPDQIYDATIQTQQVLKALVLALNDGTLPIATNKSGPQLKNIIKAHM